MNQQSKASRARWTVWEAVSHTSESNRRLVDQATGDACGGKSDRWVRTYRQLYETIVVGMPDLYARLNAHPLGKSLSAMSRLAKIRTEASRRKAAETILLRDDWQSLDDAMVAANLAASKGSRVDPNKPDIIFMTAYGKMKGPRRRVTLLALAEEMIPSDVLDMVEVFKRRRIVSENTKIA